MGNTGNQGQQRLGPAALVLLLAMTGTAAAQVVYESAEVPADAIEEIRQYRVELIVFEHNDGRQSVNEQFLPEIAADDRPAPLPSLRPGQVPEIARIGPVVPNVANEPGGLFGPPPPADPPAVQYPLRGTPEYRRWLDQQELTEVPSHILQTRLKTLDAESALPEIFATLRRLGAYRPILRAAWTQAVHEQEVTLPLDLRRIGNPPLHLDGTVTLYLGRYLHLVVDLALDAGEIVLEEDRNQARYYGDNRAQNYFDQRYDIATAPVRYRIREDRIFRTGETRYYDHPKFGVVARITRVEEAKPNPPASDEAVLLPASPESAAGNPPR